MGAKSLLDNSRYAGFISDRDKALEVLHIHAQTDISRMLYEALDSVERAVSLLALKTESASPFALAAAFEHQTLDIFTSHLYRMVNRIQRLRRTSYTLSHLGELEALGRATQRKTTKPTGIEFKRKLQLVENKPTLLDEQLNARVWLALMKIRSKACGAFRLALVQELKPLEIIQAVKDSFPQTVEYKRPPRTLKPLREADSDPKEKAEFAFDFIDEDDWNLAVQAYKDTELPPSRFDSDASFDSDTGTMRYAWELEQELADDFVKQVRDGQVDAANELGIKEFVWVVVLDNKTCDECCLPRAGLLTSEIESLLASGKLNKIKCDAITPPAHPWCRCMLGPVASTEPVEGPDWKSFNEWINS